MAGVEAEEEEEEDSDEGGDEGGIDNRGAGTGVIRRVPRDSPLLRTGRNGL